MCKTTKIRLASSEYTFCNFKNQLLIFKFQPPLISLFFTDSLSLPLLFFFLILSSIFLHSLFAEENQR
jgi:hypothetical protein